MKEGTILVIEDDKSQLEILKLILKEEGYEVETAATGRDALGIFRGNLCNLVLTDLKLPDIDGGDLMQNLLKESPYVTVIIITAFGSVNSAEEAMKLGAFDYLFKPVSRDELLFTIRKGFEKARLVRENLLFKQQLEEKFSLDNIIGRHEKMQEVFRLVQKVAPSNSTVLITGESGTGKELIAKAIHYNSQRKGMPFHAINCASVPETLLDSELFGYEKGSFTGADRRKTGLFEVSHKGTLFLDEIGDLSYSMQAKILRTLQEREIRRLGGTENIKVDVRIITATNKDLEKEMEERRFRADLYYRLSVVPLSLPPLRDRLTDVPVLVEYFINKFNGSLRRKIKGISKDALRLLMEYHWPGNVRELESAIERAVLLSEREILEVKDFSKAIRPCFYTMGKIELDIPEEGISLDDLERDLIVKAMEKSDFVITKAARLLGLSYKTLWYRIKKLELKGDFPKWEK
jgi:DNA-binding NtrC family response regulator